MRESEIEKILVDGVRAEGGKAFKFVSPGNDGVPDRIVCLPDGRTVFVELKTDVGQLRSQQRIQIAKLRKMQQKVEVVKGLKGLWFFSMAYGMPEQAAKVDRKKERMEKKNGKERGQTES